jgi:hypothetical protein
MGTADGRVLIDAALTIRRAVEDNARLGLAAAAEVSSPYGPSWCTHPYQAVAVFGRSIFRQLFGGESLICLHADVAA